MDEEGAATAAVREVEARIERMVDCLSGASATRWFQQEPSSVSLPRLLHGTGERVGDRAAASLQWVRALFNVPPDACHVRPAAFAREFDDLTEQHTELWTGLVSAACAQRDALADAGEQDRFAMRLEESERRIAYSHEVVFCAGMVWKHLLELM